MKFNESEDIVAHLSKFENLSNQLKFSDKPSSQDDEIAYLIASFPESYDSVVSYFEVLHQDQRTVTVLKSRYKSEHQNRINHSEVKEHESTDAGVTSLMSSRGVQGHGRSNFRKFSRQPTQRYNHSYERHYTNNSKSYNHLEDHSSRDRHCSNYRNRSSRGQNSADRRKA